MNIFFIEVFVEPVVWCKETDDAMFSSVTKKDDDISERNMENNAGPINIFGARENMLEQVQRDVSLWHHHQASWTFASAHNEDQEQQFSQDVSTDYSWYRILTDVVLSMPVDADNQYEEMLYVCRLIYTNQNNRTQLDRKSVV